MVRSVALFALFIYLGQCAYGRDLYHPEPKNFVDSKTTINEEELEPGYWAREAAEGIAARLRAEAAAGAGGRGRARNVVLFLGDGMSGPTVTAARTHLGQRHNRTGEEAQLAFDRFPTVGLSKTYCVDTQTADSACTATAYLCGVKANRGTLGVSAAVARRSCSAAADERHQLHSIAAWALQDGRDAGIVTTTRVTHASPAGAYAHSAERDWESDADVAAACAADSPTGAADSPTGAGDSPAGAGARPQEDIALQLVHSYPGNQFRVILGGGRREFLPNTTIDEEGSAGHRLDGRNLVAEWQEAQEARGWDAQYVWDREQLLAASQGPAPPPDRLLGLFESSHMHYHLEADPLTEPTLAELTEAAIRVLSNNPRGFFLFVEGGRIDHGHHDNQPRLALDETIEMSAAVAKAAELLDERDSLIVVTSDHSHVMTYNGYAARGADVLGPAGADERGVPYMTLSYANGPGFRPHIEPGLRDDITQYNYQEPTFRYEAGAPLASETHGGEDVAVFARGPQHAMFSGVYEQSAIPRRAAWAACLGPHPHAPACYTHE